MRIENRVWVSSRFVLVAVFLAVAVLVQLSAGDIHGQAQTKPNIITFDVPAASTGPGQGTIAVGSDAAGGIMGWYIDPNNENHGFLRARDGTITTIDVPGAGTGAGQGTNTSIYGSLNPMGAITGNYIDSSNVYHVYVRAPGGRFTTINAPLAGTAPGQGTFTEAINPEGAIIGYYLDANNVMHGFLNAPNGNFTTIDVPAAGTSAGQGTINSDLNPEGEIDGVYYDADNVPHGFLRTPDGRFTTIDVPGAGTGAYQGTSANTIDAKAEIVGNYTDMNNTYHGFLRTR